MVATTTPKAMPVVIQGGMGIAVSDWKLARAVSMAGQLGVVSGTALDAVFARRLETGDEGGHLRRALAHFPVPAMAERALKRHFIEGGKADAASFTPVPKLGMKMTPAQSEISVLANFCEVWLAKEGHNGVVGINLLEKVQMATSAAAYGAVLAGVDFVLMGAGIPAEIPALLDALANHEPFDLGVDVDGQSQKYTAHFDPKAVTGAELAPVRRPFFLAIVSGHVLATYLYRNEATRPDGFVVEGPSAGGHNTPPRGALKLDETGQPIYSERDLVDCEKMKAIGAPFWLAGGAATAEQVRAALAQGAVGVQVGTLFALSSDSGTSDANRRLLVDALTAGSLEVRTDPLASPTGFPFKVAEIADTISEEQTYQDRPRLCDLGYLRVPFEKQPGVLGYRCPAEPVDAWVKKGGELDATVGRKCLCNGLMATIGLGQTRPDGYREAALLTLGSDLAGAQQLLARHPEGWSAAQAVAFLTEG